MSLEQHSNIVSCAGLSCLFRLVKKLLILEFSCNNKTHLLFECPVNGEWRVAMAKSSKALQSKKAQKITRLCCRCRCCFVFRCVYFRGETSSPTRWWQHLCWTHGKKYKIHTTDENITKCNSSSRHRQTWERRLNKQTRTWQRTSGIYSRESFIVSYFFSLCLLSYDVVQIHPREILSLTMMLFEVLEC